MGMNAAGEALAMAGWWFLKLTDTPLQAWSKLAQAVILAFWRF